MSFLEQLSAYGVTAEDLEKAASVRLFEKAAHSEGQYSTELRNPVDAPLNSTHPNMEINPMDYIDLFEKQAADEGIDLDMLDDYELAELYNHFISEVSDDYDDYDDEYEKLAEAELLGEVMADAYLNKIAAEAAAAEAAPKPGRLTRTKNYLKGVRGGASGGLSLFGAGLSGSGKHGLEALVEKLVAGGMTEEAAVKKAMKTMRNRGALAVGGFVAAGGAGAYMLGKKRREKQASSDPSKAVSDLKDTAKARGKEIGRGFGGIFTGLGKSVTRRGDKFMGIECL